MNPEESQWLRSLMYILENHPRSSLSVNLLHKLLFEEICCEEVLSAAHKAVYPESDGRWTDDDDDGYPSNNESSDDER